MRLLPGAALVCGALVYAAAAGASGISKSATTRTYSVTLAISPSGGTSIAEGAHATAMEGRLTRRLEVHIRQRADGNPYSGARPTITLVDDSSPTMTPTPVHGANVALVADHTYSVLVTVKGERARFSFRAG